MSYGFLIPVYNHGASAYQEVQELLRYGLPVILVDDASDQENKEWLRKCEALSGLVHLVTLEKNLGKGGAVVNGFRKAKEIGLCFSAEKSLKRSIYKQFRSKILLLGISITIIFDLCHFYL